MTFFGQCSYSLLWRTDDLKSSCHKSHSALPHSVEQACTVNPVHLFLVKVPLVSW